jgi:hypothetical protein
LELPGSRLARQGRVASRVSRPRRCHRRGVGFFPFPRPPRPRRQSYAARSRDPGGCPYFPQPVRAYSKDTLGDDLRDVRTIVFGPGETRTLADFRRSGAVEGLRGGASAELIGNKLADDFASSANLQKTYAPDDFAAVRQAGAAKGSEIKMTGEGNRVQSWNNSDFSPE